MTPARTAARFEWLVVAALIAVGGCGPADDDGASSGRDGEVQAPGGDGGEAGAAGAELTGIAWRLVTIRRPGETAQPVGPDQRYTIEFGSDGRFFGLAHCNRYTGGYRLPEPGRVEFSAAAATRMACPEPSLDSEFLRALGGSVRYERSGRELELHYGADGVLTFEPDEPPATPAASAEAPDAAARDTAAGAPNTAASSAEVGRTSVYDCGGDVSFTVRTGPGEVALWTPKSLGGKYTVLSLVRSASGPRYEEGGTAYWSKGELATFELDGTRFVDCRSNPRKVPWADAARRGVTFRALGNEPAWSLEISAAKLALITDLGESRTELAYAPPTSAGNRTTYRASGEGLEIVAVVDRTPCADSMSGEAFEAAATITFDGRTYYGCGRFL
jgi:heat shock protein HslJ/uncharacterized membrane protein